MRMRRKKHLTERMEATSELLIEDPASLKGHWIDLRPDAKRVCLEIGCGKGNFLVSLSARLPDTLLIGLEKVKDVLVVAMEKIKRADIENVRFTDEDAINIPNLFAPGEISDIYLNFSNPWPARRHEKRRLTFPTFLKGYYEVLRPGGAIYMKTDNAPFFEYSLVTLKQAGFTLSDITRDLHATENDSIITEYESKFMQQGVPICSCIARKEISQV